MFELHELHVRNFAGIEEARVRFPSSGVIVIFGPNEAGKTTILNALEAVLSDIPVGTKKRSFDRFRPITRDVDPEITLHFTAGDVEAKISKLFRKNSGKATLSEIKPHVRNLTGRDAENGLQEILSEHIDHSLKDAMIVRQGESLAEFAAADVQSLSAVLGQRSPGDVPDVPLWSDSTIDTILQRVFEERGRFFTPKGKPRGELQEAEQDYRDAEAAAKELGEEYRAAQWYITEVERLQEEAAQASEKIPEAEAEIQQLQNRKSQAEQEQMKLRAATAAMNEARSELEIAQMKADHRQKDLDSLRELEKKLTSQQEALTDLRKQAAEEESQQEAARNSLAALRRERTQVENFESLAECGWRLQKIDGELNELRKQFLEGERLQTTIDRETERARAESLTEDAVEALRDARAELQRSEEVRDAAAVSIEVRSQEAKTFRRCGEEQRLGEGPWEFKATGPVDFDFEDFHVAITPAHDLSAADEQVQAARRALERLVESHHVETSNGDEWGIGAARTRLREKQGIQRRIDEAELTLKTVTGGRDLKALKDEVEHGEVERERLAERFADVQKDRPATSEDWVCVPEELDLERTEFTEDDLASIRVWAKDCDEQIHRQHELLEGMGSGKIEQMAVAKSNLAALETEVADKAEFISDQRENCSDEDLRRAQHEAQERLAKQERLVGHIEQDSTAGSVEDISLDLQGAETMLRNARKVRSEAREQLARVQAQLSTKEGIAEDLAEAENRSERARHKLSRIQARAAAAQLLYETLHEAQQRQRERYQAPLRSAFESLSSQVFGSEYSFTFNENLGLKERIVGERAIRHDWLSGGAREQTQLIARLAIASVVGKGGGAPILIDDALGFSDPRRARAMNTVLGILGREHQVIVFTCDPARYERTPQAHMLSMDDIKSSGNASAT